MSEQYSFPKEKIKVLLLEGIHPAAEETFRAAGYSAIENIKSALTEEQLLRKINGVHILGIRSKTAVTRRVMESGRRLISVGCFCIGTDQVDLKAATENGLAVFNAPFSNTRSVAELTIAEVVMLARHADQRSMEMHAGRWEKSAAGCFEVRQKTIGIIGYGHIGPQVGLLAEALGMRVVFHDIVKKLPLANARQAASLDEVLRLADFVTLHVPDTPLTRSMIGPSELALMKKGSILLNLSRGSIVNVEALRDAILAGHLGGAALDVFPIEPEASGDTFQSVLRNLPNVILTPHIGGSTVEAQRSIGSEAADSLISYLDTGSSTSCVNLPQVELPILKGSHRVLNIHRDVPGVLGNINGLMAQMGVNINSQYLNTRNGVGYLIMDVERSLSRAVKKKIDILDTTIRTRLLF
jgi:D-3-phosphoglycerate dehydrogenase / 2-oxoglutarate reductase